MKSTIYYHPEAYSISGKKLMGRNAAGSSFLKGYFEHADKDHRMWAYCENQEYFHAYKKQAAVYGRVIQGNMIYQPNLGQLQESGMLFLPGPGIGEHAYRRRFYGDSSWSICGITHTTSSSIAMDAIADIISAPVQPWDALICTSNAVADNVKFILREQAKYLQSRLGANKVVLPKLPVIPLGINTSDFRYSEKDRVKARLHLNLSKSDIVVLYMGRLSFHAKAHPLAMYEALELASKATGKNLVLIECGWHANEYIENAFNDASKFACPSIKVIRLDGRIKAERDLAWCSADIFCSLSDNIQETFGIVPIEAMAAGLPVVVTDWNGYKESVRHEIDGFRIKTTGPMPGLGGDLAQRHAFGLDTYDMYCGLTSSLVSVNIDELANAFINLVADSSLRAKMGASGRQRAQQIYDWKSIIPKYEELWAELQSISNSQVSQSSVSTNAVGSDWPARSDPTCSFSHYPSNHLTLDTPLVIRGSHHSNLSKYIEKVMELELVKYASFIFPSDQEFAIINKNISLSIENKEKYITPNKILEGIDASRKAFALRSLSWLLKLGILGMQ